MPYLARRALNSLFLLFGVSLLSFLIIDLAPGEFFDEMRTNPRISNTTIDGLRSEYGLDLPLPIRYIRWLESAMKGEGGFSLAYDSPAAPILWSRAQNTLLLTVPATLAAWLIALPFGIWSAAKPRRWPDTFAAVIISALLAVPEILLALLLLLFAVRSRYFPVGGASSLDFSQMSLWSKSEDLARHLFLPVACLTAGLLPLLLSHVRASIREVLASPFIAAAGAHGIPLSRLLFRHALPAAANPLISLFGFSIGVLLSSSLVVEGVFGWPGLGQLLIESILQRDFYLVVDAVVLATVLLIGGNLLADVLLYFSDPRIRVD